jgi:RNA polymerase sigma-70 factor (ECF subfamily)
MTSDERFDEILAAAQSGAEWALGALHEDLQPTLLRYLRVHELRVAEDLAHDVWLGVALGIRRFSGGEGDFRAWLFTIARRRLLDLRRTDARRRTFPMEARKLVPWRRVANSDGQALAVLGADLALSCIAMLPPPQADVVLLRVLGGLSVDEVAKVLGERPGAVRALQRRALHGLATILARAEINRMRAPREAGGEAANPYLRLDAATADRLLGGRIAPDDPPQGHGEVAGLLRPLAINVASRPAPGGQSTVRMMAKVVGISDPPKRRRRPRSLRPRSSQRLRSAR